MLMMKRCMFCEFPITANVTNYVDTYNIISPINSYCRFIKYFDKYRCVIIMFVDYTIITSLSNCYVHNFIF